MARAMIGKQDVQLLQNKRDKPAQNTVLKTKNLWCFDEMGVARLQNLSIEVKGGEILGIGGVEGNGQTELIHALIGTLKLSAGEILLGENNLANSSVEERREAGIGFISDDRMTEGLVLDGTVEENVIAGNEKDPQFSTGILLNKKGISSFCEQLKEKYDIKGLTQNKHVKMLSGGNMQKIVLAREIERNPKVLIAAQPTRGLDIGAINFVRKLLLEQRRAGTAVILVSADLEELMSLSDRMLILFEGTISGEITDITNTTEEEIGLLMGGAVKYGK